MAERRRVSLYCEDRGHELFVRSLLRRLGNDLGLDLVLRVPSGRGGHGRALSEFRAWQRAQLKGSREEVPDLLVLVIDGNCQGWNEAQRKLAEAIDETLFPRWVVGCPDPHIERWCLADPISFQEVVGGPPRRDPGKCDRAVYKSLLRQSLEDAGHHILTGEMEFAPELVEAMDIFRAGKSQPSLRHFVQQVKTALQRPS